MSSGEPRYPYVLVDVPPEATDDAGASLFELGATGVEERDASTLVKGASAGKVTLVASFATHDEARAAIEALDGALSPRLEEVVGDAWRDEWKKHFHPFEICPGVVIRPPWEPYENVANAVVLELEPGRAFGTGLHETTSLVAAALHDHAAVYRGQPILDVGCGSGILSLVALKLGAASARAIDIDPEAVAVTKENAARNGLEARVRSDTADVARVAEQFSLVVANIEAKVLVPMAPALIARTKKGGLIVLSGILAPEVSPQLADVKHAYRALRVSSVRTKGEWSALVLEA